MLPSHGHLNDYKNGKEVSVMIWRHYNPDKLLMGSKWYGYPKKH